MTPTDAAVSGSPAAHRKSTARVALVGLPENAAQIMGDCFRQSGIEPVSLKAEHAERLRREKFEACVLPLGDAAAQVIELARSSASNGRIVVYGVGGTAQDAMLYSRLCVNVMFQEPLERSTTMKLVRSSRSLVMHEFRRYARIPLMTEVGVTFPDGTRTTATSLEISSGGMSLKSEHLPESNRDVEVTFSLLTLPRIWLRAKIAWKNPGKTFGVRFDPSDKRRQRLKDWIVSYLEN